MNDAADRHQAFSRVPLITDMGGTLVGRATGSFRCQHQR